MTGGRLLTCLGLAAAILVGSATPGIADPDVRSQSRQIEVLRDQVEQLEITVGVAGEDYAAAQQELSEMIISELSADASLRDAEVGGAAQRGVATRRARALYMSGGELGLAATVLEGRDITEVLHRVRAVRTLIGDDAAAVLDARASVQEAETATRTVTRLRARRAELELEAEQARQRAETALEQHRTLLLDADARLVELVAEQRRREEEAALAAAQRAALERAAAQIRASAAAERESRTAGSAGSTGTAALPALAAPSAAAARAVEAAQSRIGLPYVWGATGPDSFDCSGLTSWAYRQAGVAIPRTSRQQFAGLPKVPVDQLAPGDLVFWASGPAVSDIHHVALYVGDGLMIQAPRTGDVVKLSAVWGRPMYGAVRPAAITPP